MFARTSGTRGAGDGDGVRNGEVEGERRAARRPVFEQAVVYIVLALLLPVRVASLLSWIGYGPHFLLGLVFLTAEFAAVLPYALSPPDSTDRLRRWRPLAVQAVVTYLPFLALGGHWVPGNSGLLVASILFAVPGRAAWAASAAAVGVDVLLTAFVIVGPSAFNIDLYAGTASVDNGVALYGLATLAKTLRRLDTTRLELAAGLTATERVRAGEDLTIALRPRLAEIVDRLRHAVLVSGEDRQSATADVSADVGAVVRTAREGLAHVRAIAGEYRTAGRTGVEERFLTPNAARVMLLVLMTAYSVQTVANEWIAADSSDALRSRWMFAAAAVAVAVVTGLQFRHSRLRPDGAGPNGTRWTLALQAVLVAGPLICFGEDGGAQAGFVAGSTLLLLSRPAAWIAFAAVPVVLTVADALDGRTLGGLSWADGAYTVLAVLSVGFALYGLGRLTAAVWRLEATRRRIAATAVLRERLRVARDVHDLVGSGMSTLAVKGDLVMALMRRDPDRADRQLAELLEIALRAQADAEAVIDATASVDLETELDAARALLEGLDAPPTGERDPEPVPREADALLATTLREAVANIVRHTTPRHVSISLRVREDSATLTISNDITPPLPALEPGDRLGWAASGLAGLADRVHAAGGRFSAGPDAGRFHVMAQLPFVPLQRGSGRASLAPARFEGLADNGR